MWIYPFFLLNITKRKPCESCESEPNKKTTGPKNQNNEMKEVKMFHRAERNSGSLLIDITTLSIETGGVVLSGRRVLL